MMTLKDVKDWLKKQVSADAWKIGAYDASKDKTVCVRNLTSNRSVLAAVSYTHLTGLPGEEPPKETQFFGVNRKKLDALVKSTTKDFDDAQQAVYRKMDDVYRDVYKRQAVYIQTAGCGLLSGWQ